MTMKTPFESEIGNKIILFLCIGLGIYLLYSAPDLPKESPFWGVAIAGALIGFLIYLVLKFPVLLYLEYRRRIENDIPLDVILETNPDVVKGRMLELMYYGHPDGDDAMLAEFNKIFRYYPQWNLEEWDYFRAWYKDFIDFVLSRPDLITITKNGGHEYVKEEDSLYDPDAPDWEPYEYVVNKVFSEIESERELKRKESERRRDNYARALGIGMGIGLVSGITGGNGGNGS